jgi:intracellular septation protein A
MGSLFFAGRALLQDLLPTVVFAVLVALKVDLAICTAVAMAISIGHIGFFALTKRPIAPLQWASLGLVIVFGTAGILTHDARFLMVKPSLIYVIVGAVMLKRGWMLRYLPPVSEGRGAGAMIVFGYVWAGLMFLTAAANLVTAIWFAPYWPAFLAIFPMTSKIVLFAIHYVTVRHIAMREVRAEQAAAQVQAA